MRVRAVVLALAVGAATARAQCPDGSPLANCTARPAVAPPSVAERGRRFLVLPFRNVSRAPEHDWLVEGATAMIGESLARWQEIKVVADDRLYPALRRHTITPGTVIDPARVRRIAEETGGWTAVTGDIVATGGRVRVTARAYDVVSGRAMVSATAEAPAGGDVRSAFESIATRLLHAAGLETATADLSGVTTRSLDAYRAYLRGMSFNNRAQFRQAREALLEAVRIDSTFAQAYFALAEAALFAEPFSAFDPNSVLNRALSRSVSMADHFAPAERELFLGVVSIFGGRLAAAREVLSGRIAQDSSDVRAIGWHGFLEYADGVLVDGPGGPRRRGSLNQNLRLSKRLLTIDAARHDAYVPLTGLYLVTAGAFPVVFPAYRQEAGNLLQMMSAFPARLYVPVLRDSIVMVPAESLASIPPDSLAAARRRGLDSATAVTNRWLAAGPNEGVAHHVAAEIALLGGDFTRAADQLRVADSLGMEFGGLDSRLVRLSILARTGKYDEARRYIDATNLGPRLGADLGIFAFLEEGLAPAWGFSLYMMTGQYERAGDLLDSRIKAVQTRGINAMMAEAVALPMLAGERVPPTWLVDLPLAFRMDVLDSVWTRSPAGTGGPRLDAVRARMARLASRAATAANADPTLADRARKSKWFVP